MATLTDEERAANILGDVEPEEGAEPAEEDQAPPEPETEPNESTEEPEQEKPDEEPPVEDSSFTKQFPNLKGETLAEYNTELETAYDNSFKEALRLNQVIKDNATIVEQAKQILAQQAPEQPANPAQPPVPAVPAPSPALSAIDEHPVIQEFKERRRTEMITAFDEFKKDYPQATDQTAFDQFTKASDGINAALTTALGHKPSDLELFKAIAGSLGWQSTNNSARIKENAASGRTPSNQSAAQPRPSKVSDAQVEAYIKLQPGLTSMTREQARKELSEVV